MAWVWPTTSICIRTFIFDELWGSEHQICSATVASYNSKIEVKIPWLSQERSPNAGSSLVFNGVFASFLDVQVQATYKCIQEYPRSIPSIPIPHPFPRPVVSGSSLPHYVCPGNALPSDFAAAELFIKAWLSQAHIQSPSWSWGAQPFKNGNNNIYPLVN